MKASNICPYPIVADLLLLDTVPAGVFIGASIHDVAQVVGAGFSMSEETGEVATVVKLIRVALLAPVILITSLIIRRIVENSRAQSRPPIVPGFVVAFVGLVALNSFGLIPAALTSMSVELSRWALLTAIGAVGLKTSIKNVVDVGPSAIALLVAETAFIGVLTLGDLYWFALT